MLLKSQWLRENALPDPAPRCLCCGQCCEAFGGHLEASKTDLARWRAHGRDDILRRVSSIGWLWIDPETGRLADACPYLETTGPETKVCGIYEERPEICRDYPTLAHGKRCLRGVFLGLALPFLAEAAETLETLAVALG